MYHFKYEFLLVHPKMHNYSHSVVFGKQIIFLLGNVSLKVILVRDLLNSSHLGYPIYSVYKSNPETSTQ